MIYTIENNNLSVSIQHLGAEICSIKSKISGQEYMWDANQEFWGSYAPVLFPIIGCLKNNTYRYKGQDYSIPKHGFIRNNNELEVLEKTEDKLALKYEYNEETLKMYPFKFAFYISFQVSDNKLIVNHKVENLGSDKMLFSLGAHPAFKCPFNSDEKYEDYFIEFEHAETDDTWLLSDKGLTNGKTQAVLNNTNKLPLTDSLFDNDALIFKNIKSNKATLKSKNHSKYISVTFPDFNYLGIWAKPKAPFVCIEPWLGITDDENCSGNLNEKEGIIRLKSEAQFEAKFEVEVGDN